MDAKKSVRQYKPASKMPARRKKKKTGWIGWFRSNIKDNDEVDPKKRGEHGDNLRFVWGAVLATLSLAILIALISHIFTGAEDQKYVTSESYTAANWLGRWGYEVAHWLMDNTFGVSSILIPILMLATSIRIMGLAKVRLHLWFLNCMIIMAWASAFAAYVVRYFPGAQNTYIIWGGMIGQNELDFLQNKVGGLGTLLIFILSALLYIFYLSDEAITWIRHKVIREKKEETEEAENEVEQEEQEEFTPLMPDSEDESPKEVALNEEETRVPFSDEAAQTATTIDFAEGLQYIGSWAFAYCYNLKELRMPTSLRQIDEYAFKSCSGLSEVHVPSMITQIGDYAFKNCGLKSVYAYTLTPVQINQDTFDYTGTELFAPKTSFYTYYINTQWAQFPILKEFDAKYLKWYTPRDYDIQINTTNPIPNEDDENRAEGNMEPGSGLIFIGDGQQLVKDLILNWQHGANYPALIEDGNLDVEELKFIMNVYPGRWYFFSFPFDIKISDTSFDGKYVWRYYDAEERAENGSGGWKNVTDGWLRANVGYIFQANKEGDLELPVNNPQFAQSTGQKEVPLESHPATNAQDASWNFVGNPNLSYYDLDDVENSGFTAPITVWDEEQQTYTAVVPGDDEYDFHPFQAYFVQTPENTDNLTFDDENRSTYVQTEQKAGNRSRAHAARRVNEKRLLVNLILSNG